MNINFYLINTIGSTIWGARENIKITFEMSSTFMLWNMGKWKSLGGNKICEHIKQTLCFQWFQTNKYTFQGQETASEVLTPRVWSRWNMYYRAPTGITELLLMQLLCFHSAHISTKYCILCKLFKNNYRTCCKSDTMFNSFLEFSTTGYLNTFTLMHQRSTGTLPTGIQLHVSSTSGHTARF